MVTADRHQSLTNTKKVFTVHNFSVFSRKFSLPNGRILGQAIFVAVFICFLSLQISYFRLNTAILRKEALSEIRSWRYAELRIRSRA